MGELSICAGWKTGTVDEAPRSDAAPETSTGPTIERRAIKTAALLPRFHATSPAIVSLGAAWLGAEQFRPQHVRNKGRPADAANKRRSIISPSLAIAVPGISLRPRSRLGATLSKEGREGHVLGRCVRSLQDRAGETSWHHNRIRGLPDGWIPVTPFRSNPQP